MRMLSRLLPAAAAVFALAAPASAADYVLDTAHTSVGFQIRHLAGKVRGSFNTFQGSFSFDPAKPEASTGSFVIDTASIDTNQPKRDAHLRSTDFFEVEKFPKMTYVVKGVKKQGADYVIDGDLTIRDVTKRVPLTVEYLGQLKDPWGNVATSFDATAKIDRKDFGLTWNKALEAGGFLVGDEVLIEIHVEANPKPAETKK